MIPFLVKLANLLDDRGQHKMAREVDDLIEKLAQATSSYTQDWLAAHKNLKGYLQRLKEVVTAPDVVKKINDYQGSIDALMARAGRNQLSPEVVDWSVAAWEEFKGVLRNIYNQIPENTGLREAFRDLDVKMNQPAAVKAELPKAAPQAQPAQEQASPGAASKAPAQAPAQQQAPAKKKHQPNKQTMDTIRLIQNAIGAPVSGQWDKETNNAFIAYMNKNLPLAMKDNKFVGLVTDDKGTRSGNKLADAWELIKEQEGASAQLAQEMANKPPAEQTGKASKAPAAKPATPAATNFKSKFHQMTPAAMSYLARMEKARPGSGQDYINQIDRTPSQTQADFEDALKDAAESMEDNSGKGRLDNSFRRS